MTTISILIINPYKCHILLENSDESITEKIQPKILEIQFKENLQGSQDISLEKIRLIVFGISAFGMNFRLSLKQSRENPCKFNGNVNRTPDFMGEFNLCNGMEGTFQWNSYIYFIEPTNMSKSFPGFTALGTKLLPHIIYYAKFNIKKPLFTCDLIQDKRIAAKIDIPGSIRYSNMFSRQKRQASVDYPVIDSEIVENSIIELLIVVTSSFRKRFKGDLNQYILNNVAIASNLLRHPTINTSIAIEIVDIISLDPDYEKKHTLNDWSSLSQDSVVSLFCQWLQDKKYSLNYFWDSAILVNDGYFSSNAIGIAHLRSMCNDNNCLAVVDRGFGTGFIIAHELAHQMNARHDYDDVEICRIFEPKNEREIVYNTIMSTSLYFENYPFVWSTCSQTLINTFLRSKFSACLKHGNKMPNLYSQETIAEHFRRFSTGVEYDLDQQCSFAFGEPAEYCYSKIDKLKKCSTLYCRLRRHHLCLKADAIIADGTQCDKDKHCVHGECVAKNLKFDPIDGGWSNYSPWSNCSRSCDGGVEFSHRFCNNPVPSLGGRFCVGTKERIRSCNVQKCSRPVDPREESCKKQNLKPYIPQIYEEFACNLVCISENQTLKYDIELTDGTPCSPHSSDICVKGICFKTGCDRVVGSKKVYDHCYKCGGYNDTCTKVEGHFNGSQIFGVKMMKAFTVPVNVTNLFIKKVSQRTGPFTEQVFDDFELLLLIDRSTMIRRSETIEPFAGGELHYSGSNKKIETIEVKGQIKKEIVVIIKMENQDSRLSLPSIAYHYYVIKDTFAWKYLEVDALFCKRQCNGVFEVNPVCVREMDNHKVEEDNCLEYLKPEPQKRSCSLLCGYRWEKPGEEFVSKELKNACPIKCGIGKLRIHYFCQENDLVENNNWKTVNASHCLSSFMSERPYEEVECIDPCIPPMWSYGNWDECPMKCGSAFRYRSSYCIDEKGILFNPELCLKYVGPPDDRQACLSFKNCQNLTNWVSSPWSSCSKTCDIGIQRRTSYCFKINKDKQQTKVLEDRYLKEEEQMSDMFCQVHTLKPSIEQPCQVSSCFQWVLNEKAKCSITCGNGSQIQNYLCRNTTTLEINNSFVDDEACLERNLTKPNPIIKVCSNKECEIKPFWIRMNWTKCSVSCGMGFQERSLKCGYINSNNTIEYWSNNDKCRNIVKPPDIQKCNMGICPAWIYGPWSECKGTCLYGMQQRTVICSERNSLKTYPDVNCNISLAVPSSRKCLLSDLCGYWVVGEWSQCSVTCGLGIKTRKVSCHYINGTKSKTSSICKNLSPFDTIHCKNKMCKSGSFWWLMKTSECYGYECNPGIMYANVRCINDKFEVLVDDKCRGVKHPNYYVGCLKNKCRQYFWVAKPWEYIPCSVDSCMIKIRNRNVDCVDEYGKVYSESFCDETTKPDNWRLCPSPRQCSDVPRSCKELKDMHHKSIDNEYNLAIDLNWVYSVYCADMDTNEPKEYLTMKELNYARSSKFIYDFRSKDSCVYNKEIEQENACPGCQIDESLQTITYYEKIRINLQDLTVNVMDNRFSITNGPSYMPYGTAKDCSGSNSCPKGHFHIDLRGTGFSVSMKTKWNEIHNNDGYRILRKQSSQIVEGWCGGSCLGCYPLEKLYIEPQMYGRDYESKSIDIL